MTDLTSMYEMASTRQKLELCSSLLSVRKAVTDPIGGGDPPLTTCELARIQLAQAIIAEALACG